MGKATWRKINYLLDFTEDLAIFLNSFVFSALVGRPTQA
jgi:hypothetical protein